MSEQVEKKLYVVNHKSSLPVMMGGQEYKIPSGATSIEDLAKKLDVDEDLALSVAKHAASVYATVRPSTGAKERQKPPQKWVELVTRPVDEPAPKSRSEVIQELVSDSPDPTTTEEDFEYLPHEPVLVVHKSSATGLSSISSKDLKAMLDEEEKEPLVSYSVRPRNREEIYNRSLKDNN